jgi:uncharacterized protein (DUF697 family)
MDAIATPPAPVAVATEPEVAELTKQQKSEKLIKDHILWSAGAGLIPFPLLDIAGITAAQIRLVSKMSEVYGVPFSEHRVKNIVTPLIASIGVVPAGAAIISSLVKSVPVLGTAVGVASMPVVAGATTYAIGKVFISHFEAGGTLLDFNPEKMKAYYAEMFKEGKKVAETTIKEQEVAAKPAKK